MSRCQIDSCTTLITGPGNYPFCLPHYRRLPFPLRERLRWRRPEAVADANRWLSGKWVPCPEIGCAKRHVQGVCY